MLFCQNTRADHVVIYANENHAGTGRWNASAALFGTLVRKGVWTRLSKSMDTPDNCNVTKFQVVMPARYPGSTSRYSSASSESFTLHMALEERCKTKKRKR